MAKRSPGSIYFSVPARGNRFCTHQVAPRQPGAGGESMGKMPTFQSMWNVQGVCQRPLSASKFLCCVRCSHDGRSRADGDGEIGGATMMDGGGIKMEKACSNCVSRFLCPNNYRVCSGWNDEGLFWGFIKLNFPLPEKSIDRQRAFIKSLQEENEGRRH